MKTFTKLFLTLALMASPVQAVIDLGDILSGFENLPTEVPTDIQDKLAWGLLNLDKQVVTEALDAGANPSPVYTKSDVPEHAYLFAVWGITIASENIEKLYDAQLLAANENIDEFQTRVHIDTIAMTQTIHKASEIFELLIMRGVSVDEPCICGYMMGPFSMREAIARANDNTQINNIDEDMQGSWKREYQTHTRAICKHLQLLVDKYQPEVIPQNH